MSKVRVPYRERENDWAIHSCQELAELVAEMPISASQQALLFVLREFERFQKDDRRMSFFPADILDELEDVLDATT